MPINRGDKLDAPPFRPYPEEQDRLIERHERDEARRLDEKPSRAQRERSARAYWERRGGHDEW